MLVGRLLVDGDLVSLGYADVFVVVREGQPGPGPNDWEVTVRTPAAHPWSPACTSSSSTPSTGPGCRAGRCCASATAAGTCSGAMAT
jgi:hypothetical protein